MSGLNDDIDNELPPFIEPVDGNGDQPNAPNVVLVNEVDKSREHKDVPADKLFGEPLVPNELPNLNAEFKIITEGIYAAQDLNDLRNHIAKANAVSQEVAAVVNKLQPGFLSDDLPLGYFTEKPSRTQFTQTLNSIDSALETNCEKIKASLIDTTTKVVSSLRPVLKTIQDKIANSSAKMLLMTGELAVMAVDENKPPALAELFGKLESNIPGAWVLRNAGTPDTEEVDNKAAAITLEFLPMLAKGKNRSNLLNVINPVRQNLQHAFFSAENELFGLSETEPFYVDVSKDARDTFYFSNTRLVDFLTNGMDMYAIEYFTKLGQVAANAVEAIAATNATIEELNKKTGITSKDRLDLLVRLTAINQKYAMRTISIVSFVNDYFKAVDNIVAMTMAACAASANTVPTK